MRHAGRRKWGAGGPGVLLGDTRRAAWARLLPARRGELGAALALCGAEMLISTLRAREAGADAKQVRPAQPPVLAIGSMRRIRQTLFGPAGRPAP
jgi:hypothetical protein